MGRFGAVKPPGVGQYPKDYKRLITSLWPTGHVIFQDDFKALGVGWKVTQVAGGKSFVTPVSNVPSHSGCALYVPTSQVNSGWVEVNRQIGIPPSVKVGLEFKFAVLDPGDLGSFRFGVEYYDGSYRNYTELKYTPSSGVWTLAEAGGTTEDILTRTLYADASYPIFHHMKLVINHGIDEYVEFWLDKEHVDLTGKSTYYDRTASSNRYLYPWFLFYDLAAAALSECYIADVILTMEE